MSQDQSLSASGAGPSGSGPQVEVGTRRGISIVWLIPVVAGVIAVWLAYTTISEQGPEITIDFKTAVGLEAGKTKIKFRDVEVGLVDAVTLKQDLSGVTVTASLESGSEPHLNEQTRFWVVRPRLGAGGVSGLDTLVSGSYIEISPGQGQNLTKAFVGLETPPVIRLDVPGKEFTLISETRGSLGPGAPILYTGVRVGQILGDELAENGSQVTFLAFVQSPYDQWVTPQSRFWNESGIEVEVGADGVNVRTGSLETILSGGIAFETPPSTLNEPAEEGTIFQLLASRGDIVEESIHERIPYVLYFDGSVRGLNPGAPVELLGIRIGSVREVRLEVTDQEDNQFRIPVVISIEPERAGVKSSGDPYGSADALIRRGLRGQLRSGSLLTGQLYVALDFFPDAEPAELGMKGLYPEIPTVPQDIEQITQSATEILQNLAALPLDELIADVRRTVQGVEVLVDSPEMKQSVKSLDSALAGVDKLVQRDVGPMLANLRQASASADTALEQANNLIESVDGLVGADAQLRFDLMRMVNEFSEAANSIRVLADFLEQNPDALLRGKGGVQ